MCPYRKMCNQCLCCFIPAWEGRDSVYAPVTFPIPVTEYLAKGLRQEGLILAHSWLTFCLTLASQVQRDGKVMAVAVGGHSWDLVSKQEAETDEQ